MRPGRFRYALAVILAACAGAGVLAQHDEPAVDLGGRLYRSVFSGGAGALSAADLERVPEPLRARLSQYLTRRAAFKSQYKSQADTFDAVRIDAKRRLLEQAIVSLIPRDGIGALAAEYVATVPIEVDLKGLPAGPLAEANHAESVLKKDPGSPLAPWLYVFIAQRQRAAFEAYEREKNPDGMRAAARKYRAFAERARAATDTIIPALMGDLDRQAFVHLKTTTHPRDYNPDG